MKETCAAMEVIELYSSSEDDDYLNPVAKLKVLKRKQALLLDTQKNKERIEKQTEELKIITPKKNVTQRRSRKGSARVKGYNTRSSTRKQSKVQDSTAHDSDLEICSVEYNLPTERIPNLSDSDLLIIENSEDQNLYSSEDENYDLSIKILWRSNNMHRLNIRRNENFQKIFEYFADLEQVSIDEILIMKKDKSIKKTDTPTTINLSVIDILEGGVIKKNENQSNAGQKDDEDACVIKIQTTSKKTIMVSIKRDDNFGVVLAKCAHDLDVEESKIKLYFDGDLIAPTDTPKALDIEDEACIDLRLSS